MLEGLREGVKGEVEALTRQLQGVRAQLAPWEARIAAAQSAADVAASERDLLQQQQEAAQKRLKVQRTLSLPPTLILNLMKAHNPRVRKWSASCLVFSSAMA